MEKRASMYLKHYGIYERVKHKLVFGESISQVNQFITTGSADIGFTAYSVVSYTKMKTIGKWTTINLNEPWENSSSRCDTKRIDQPRKSKSFL